jgi:hypothetical protein
MVCAETKKNAHVLVHISRMDHGVMVGKDLWGWQDNKNHGFSKTEQ